LNGQVVEEDGVEAAEDKREDSPLEGLEDHCLHVSLLGLLQEIFGELAVEAQKEEEPDEGEDEHQKEEVKDEDVGQFVAEAGAEKVAALAEEVEGEHLDVPFVDEDQQQPSERVLSEVL
jgi:vacuolar-type H+-ATPase subunit I/STV1